MVSVNDLDKARPQAWRDAASDALTAARECADLASTARDEVASTLAQCWVDDTGRAARRKFVKHADEFEAAAASLRGLAKVYDDLADAIEAAQREVQSALAYARSHDLRVCESGLVQQNTRETAPGETDRRITQVQILITEALRKATKADTEAASMLRTLQGLTEVEDPTIIGQAFSDNGKNPLAIALRLQATGGTLHRINVGPGQLAAVEKASGETRISKTLLLAILWQEQQWYQNYDSDLKGPLPFTGRVFDWSLEETVKPDKSLGITHIKLTTARKVMNDNVQAFTTPGGQSLGDLSDSQLTKYIEENPDQCIRLSAYYLRDMQKNPHGADTDKQLFMLYAADTDQVRESNAEYGDSSRYRGGAIKDRAENWDRLQPQLQDAQAWAALSQDEQLKALSQLESQTPAGHHIDLSPIYDAGFSTGTGTGAAEPGTPAPEPGPSPRPLPGS